MTYTLILKSDERINKNTTSANDCEYMFDWSLLDEGNYRVKYSIYKSLLPTIIPLTFTQLLVNKPPWARYNPASFNATTQIWNDTTANGRNAVCSGVLLTPQTAIANGSGALLSGLTGSITGTIQFPVGSVPPTHTLCFITRYRTALANRRRILVTDQGGYFGHNTPTLRGVVNYGNTALANSVLTEPAINYLNMCVSSSGVVAPNNILVNGVPNGITGVPPINPFSSTLAVNIGTLETSGFEFNQMIIWDTALTETELAVVSTALTTYLATGTVGL